MTEPIRVAKVDEGLSTVFGWGLVTSRDGKPYIDLQGDSIGDDVMVKAVSAFNESDRTAKLMHVGGGIGRVTHSFALTEEIAKAMGLQTRQYGWMVGVKIDDPAILQKFKTGELTGFSIAGTVSDFEEVA